MKIRAALLTAPPASGKGVFVRIDELDAEDEITENHLRAVTACDLAPNRYVWVPNTSESARRRFPEGGTFVDHAAIARRNRPDGDLAFAGLCGAVEALGGKLPEETRAYLAYLGARRGRRQARKGGNG